MQIFIEKLHSFVWSGWLIALLLGTGVFYTIKLRGIQFRLPILLKKNVNIKGQLKTVCMSLGASMGTGNIAGTAAALAIGGAGSVFWMWVSAFFGMALVYAENMLSATYSTKDVKGPMAYLLKGADCPALSYLFAVFCVFASFGMGGMVQTNTFSLSLKDVAEVPPFILAAAVFAAVFLITSGGASRIGTAAQLMLPFASVMYMGVCAVVIVLHFKMIPSVFGRIFTEALGLRQFAGGFSGCAVAVGIRRGLFSNEAGLGSSPVLHSSSDAENTETFAVWSMFEVFFDTVVCCTLTVVTVMCASDCFSVADALSCVTGGFTGVFLTVINGLFALCTIIGWYYCGETSFLCISGKRFKVLFCLAFLCTQKRCRLKQKKNECKNK